MLLQGVRQFSKVFLPTEERKRLSEGNKYFTCFRLPPSAPPTVLWSFVIKFINMSRTVCDISQSNITLSQTVCDRQIASSNLLVQDIMSNDTPPVPPKLNLGF